MVYNYHQRYLAFIKKTANASFCGYVREKEDFKLKIIKDKQTYYFDLTGTPNDVTPEKYIKLANTVNEQIQKIISNAS